MGLVIALENFARRYYFYKYQDIRISLLQVLWLLWHLAHSDDLPTDIMDQALVAHIKILDFSCSQVNAVLKDY